MTNKSNKPSAKRTRTFATILYPDSAAENWQDVLAQAHVQALVSPLHDKDRDPSGKPKKSHYHILIMYDSPKNFDNQVKPLFDRLGAVGREEVNSLRGYARYLIHADNPDKYQYNKTDILEYGGACYDEITRLQSDDRKDLIDLMRYIRINKIYSMAELIDVTSMYHPDYFDMIATKRGYIIDKYIKSLVWETESEYKRKKYYVDLEGAMETMDNDKK